MGTGKRKTLNNQKWIKQQLFKEECIKKNVVFNGIECPQHKDVLSGRGWPIMNHPGNTLFRNFLEAKFDAYANAKSKNEKTTIAWSIVFELKESYGSRFLREDGLWWYEVSIEVAREKVSVGFRDVRKSRSKSSIYSSSASNSNNIQATTEVAATTAAAAATTTKRKCDYETTAPMISAAAKGFRVFDNQ